MRFFTFHYMPYQGLDAVQAIDEYGVGWCTLPNSMCDPEVMAANYRDYVDQAALADELDPGADDRRTRAGHRGIDDETLLYGAVAKPVNGLAGYLAAEDGVEDVRRTAQRDRPVA